MRTLYRSVAFLVALTLAIATFAGSGSFASERAPLAIKGYDPVAYFTEKRPTVGDPQYRYEWDGTVYQFASARHLEMFKADPDRYLPQYNSLCAASLSRGITYEANPEYWLVADDRLYLFGGPSGPGAMEANLETMRHRADENYTKLSHSAIPARQ